MSKIRSPTVFISYSIKDKPRLERVIGELKYRGILGDQVDIIDDRHDLDMGSDWSDQLRKAIEDSSKVIVIWSGASAASPWVNYEAGMADALGKPMVFVIPKGERAQLPTALMHNQIIEVED